MKYKYSKQNEQIVEAFFQEPASVEQMNQLGTGGKIKVKWDKGIVEVRGSKGGMNLSIDDILDCHYCPSNLTKKLSEIPKQ